MAHRLAGIRVSAIPGALSRNCQRTIEAQKRANRTNPVYLKTMDFQFKVDKELNT